MPETVILEHIVSAFRNLCRRAGPANTQNVTNYQKFRKVIISAAAKLTLQKFTVCNNTTVTKAVPPAFVSAALSAHGTRQETLRE